MSKEQAQIQEQARAFDDMMKWHLDQYPAMQPQDAIKLTYQNEFGCGHGLTSFADCLARIQSEHKQWGYDSSQKLIEDIGNGYCRINLKAIPDDEYAFLALSRLFMASANAGGGDTHSFEQKINRLPELIKNTNLTFSAAGFMNVFAQWKEERMPLPRHSGVYNDTYKPAYRVLHNTYASCYELVRLIERIRIQKNVVRIAIDGMSGSGKSTLAHTLATLYDANIISMDDFFLPPSLRTDERLGEPGGNIHYERFLDEAVNGLISGDPFEYRVFDCSAMDYGATCYVESKPISICEGSYSHHPYFGKPYDIKVFACCSPQEQARRIIKRNGEDSYARFASQWIPMENAYFAFYAIRENSDYIFNT